MCSCYSKISHPSPHCRLLALSTVKPDLGTGSFLRSQPIPSCKLQALRSQIRLRPKTRECAAFSSFVECAEIMLMWCCGCDSSADCIPYFVCEGCSVSAKSHCICRCKSLGYFAQSRMGNRAMRKVKRLMKQRFELLRRYHSLCSLSPLCLSSAGVMYSHRMVLLVLTIA